MERKRKIDISVVVPMFNEEENTIQTLERLSAVLDSTDKKCEIIIVDDGSTDKTKSLVEDFSKFNRCVKLISYSSNQGRGKALRVGFQRAQGKIICTTDADLSYDVKYIIRMIKMLEQNQDVDLVIGSPYIEGGKAEGVPFFRLLLSKLGNKVLGFAMRGKISTVTGVLRAYRSECIKSLELESDGKEIHLEILSKALSMGYKALEMPATLKVRKKGKSKFRFKATATSHIIFSFFEKPIILFGLVGLFMLLLGFLGGGYVIYLWQKGSLNPNRPLMTLIVLLVVSGIQVLLFGFLGTQLVHLRKEIYKIQRENKNLEDKINNLPAKIEVEEKEVEYLPSGRSISQQMKQIKG
jgi:dolichol-phosphate mannosyltransferase